MSKAATLQQFRIIALLEGLSFLILLFIAMPLKYIADQPLAVKYVGMIHGVLFIGYVAWLVVCHITYQWTIKFSLTAFLASIFPFGTILFDRKLKTISNNL